MADMQKNEIVRFRDGDRAAFEALYQRYWRKVLSFTRLYIKDSYEQEEVVQQVFIRLWENRTKVDVGKDFDGFLFIVTRNLIFTVRGIPLLPNRLLTSSTEPVRSFIMT